MLLGRFKQRVADRAAFKSRLTVLVGTEQPWPLLAVVIDDLLLKQGFFDPLLTAMIRAFLAEQLAKY